MDKRENKNGPSCGSMRIPENTWPGTVEEKSVIYFAKFISTRRENCDNFSFYSRRLVRRAFGSRAKVCRVPLPSIYYCQLPN